MDPKCWKEVANALKFNFMAVQKWNEGEETDAHKIHQVITAHLNPVVVAEWSKTPISKIQVGNMVA